MKRTLQLHFRASGYSLFTGAMLFLLGFYEGPALAQSHATATLWTSTSDSKPLPPSWDLPPAPRIRNSSRPAVRDPEPDLLDWRPEFSIGLGAAFPDVMPLETYVIFSKYFRIRAFYTPPLPFNIRVEMPTDVITTTNGIGIANPDFLIHMHAVYGPSYGFEGMVFPLGGSFFVSGGISQRQLTLEGNAKSPILICSKAEAAKAPPCGNTQATLVTRTQLEVSADSSTKALLVRAAMGGLWTFGSTYFTAYVGTAKPTKVTRSVAVEAHVDAPGASDDAINAALSQLEAEKEAELEDKAAKEIAPYDQKRLIILGLGLGFQF